MVELLIKGSAVAYVFLFDKYLFQSVMHFFLPTDLRYITDSKCFTQDNRWAEGVEELFYYVKVCTGSMEIMEDMTICTIHYFFTLSLQEVVFHKTLTCYMGKNTHTNEVLQYTHK